MDLLTHEQLYRIDKLTVRQLNALDRCINITVKHVFGNFFTVNNIPVKVVD